MALQVDRSQDSQASQHCAGQQHCTPSAVSVPQVASGDAAAQAHVALLDLRVGLLAHLGQEAGVEDRQLAQAQLGYHEALQKRGRRGSRAVLRVGRTVHGSHSWRSLSASYTPAGAGAAP